MNQVFPLFYVKERVKNNRNQLANRMSGIMYNQCKQQAQLSPNGPVASAENIHKINSVSDTSMRQHSVLSGFVIYVSNHPICYSLLSVCHKT